MYKKELPSLLRVYRKSAISAQTDGRIETGGPFYTGQESFFGNTNEMVSKGRIIG